MYKIDAPVPSEPEGEILNNPEILNHPFPDLGFSIMAWPFIPQSVVDNVLVKAVERASPRQRILYALLGLGTYLALASSLRFRRRQKMYKIYPYSTRESMGKMTDHDAWAIQKQILQMEFPFIVLKSLQFALFRVGHTRHPSISKLTIRRHTASRQYQACSSGRHSFPTQPPHSNDTQTRAH